MEADIIDAHYEEVVTIDLPHPAPLQQQQEQQPLTLNNISHNHLSIHHHNQQTSHNHNHNHHQHHNHHQQQQQQQHLHATHSPLQTSNITDAVTYSYSSSPSQTANQLQQPQQQDTTSILRNDTNESKANIAANSTKIEADEEESKPGNGSPKSQTRFKWNKEMSQVALRLVKHGYRPKIVSIAVGCSLRTAQKFVETVTPKIEGETFKNFEIKRRGRRSKDVKDRLEAIKEVLSKDVNKTQIEIAAELKVSNTTVCRDLKRIGTAWKKQQKDSDSQGDTETFDDSKESPKTSRTTSKSPTKDSKPKGRGTRNRIALENNTTDDGIKSS